MKQSAKRGTTEKGRPIALQLDVLMNKLAARVRACLFLVATEPASHTLIHARAHAYKQSGSAGHQHLSRKHRSSQQVGHMSGMTLK